MAAYHRAYDSHHLQANCQEPGSAPEPYAWQSSMCYLHLYLRQVVSFCYSEARSMRAFFSYMILSALSRSFELKTLSINYTFILRSFACEIVGLC